MKTSPILPTLRPLYSTVLLALACAVTVAFVQLPAVRAADSSAEKSAAEKAPLKASFEKVKKADSPPFVLKLKNTSKNPLEVSATVYLSVMSHNRDKARHVPAHVIKAGDTWTIEDLAALDKVTVNAKGFAPLELVVE